MIAHSHRVSSLILLLAVLTPSLAVAQEFSGQPFEWLVGNQAHPEFSNRLESTVEELETITESTQFARILPSLLLPPEDQERLAIRVGAILRTARRFEQAEALYALAFAASGESNRDVQFYLAQLALHSGELSRADRIAREVLANTQDYELKRRSYALIARALHAAGRNAEARQMLATLVELDDPALVEPETLLLSERVERALGNEYSASAILVESHGESVAALLGSDPQVRSAALPLRLIEFTTPVETETARPTEVVAERPAVTVTGIQVGSFSDPDNAYHMQRDVSALDLTVEVRTQTREGRSIHTVVVVLDGDSTAVVNAMERLQAAGFDGFLVY